MENDEIYSKHTEKRILFLENELAWAQEHLTTLQQILASRKTIKEDQQKLKHLKNLEQQLRLQLAEQHERLSRLGRLSQERALKITSLQEDLIQQRRECSKLTDLNLNNKLTALQSAIDNITSLVKLCKNDKLAVLGYCKSLRPLIAKTVTLQLSQGMKASLKKACATLLQTHKWYKEELLDKKQIRKNMARLSYQNLFPKIKALAEHHLCQMYRTEIHNELRSWITRSQQPSSSSSSAMFKPLSKDAIKLINELINNLENIINLKQFGQHLSSFIENVNLYKGKFNSTPARQMFARQILVPIRNEIYKIQRFSTEIAPLSGPSLRS